MTNQTILENLEAIFRDIFDLPDLRINESTDSSHIDDWDSLAHISLVAAIENEFKIKFALAELQDLKNVGDMALLIQKKIK